MRKVLKKIFISIISILILACGFIFLLSGDAVYYLPIFQNKVDNDLSNKTVVFLGSSVTKGFGSFDVSFVNYLNKIYSVNTVKETVNGTTLIDNGEKSYVARLKALDKRMNVDMLICQLSTNDATKGSPLGEISESFNVEDFDASTVAGAIEYMIAYSQDTYNCKVGFYTSMKYDSEQYEQMYDLMMKISEKWGVPVLDLWNNEELNQHSIFHMVDDIHPTMICYKNDLTPLFYEFIKENI